MNLQEDNQRLTSNVEIEQRRAKFAEEQQGIQKDAFEKESENWGVQASKLAIDTKDLIFGHFDRDDSPMISEKKWPKIGS